MRSLLIFLALIIAIAGAYYYYFEYSADEPAIQALPSDGKISPLSEIYIQGTWEKEARYVLRNYLSANTSYGKVPYILQGEDMLPELDKYYSGALINDLDTPVEEFTVKPLAPEDHQRGLFRMVYEAKPTPSQTPGSTFFTNKYLVYPQESLGQPTRIHAFFLHTPDGLKLDWEVFAQTKYRTLLNFAKNPNPRRKQTFRVLIAQDTPSNLQNSGQTLGYRIADPANTKDVIRASTQADSQVAEQLSSINWVGNEGRKPATRTATIELAWRGEDGSPQLVIHRFICWEFLGLGGQRSELETQDH